MKEGALENPLHVVTGVDYDGTLQAYHFTLNYTDTGHVWDNVKDAPESILLRAFKEGSGDSISYSALSWPPIGFMENPIEEQTWSYVDVFPEFEEMGEEALVATPPPVITVLEIDCSGGIVPGYCMSGGETYSVTFTVTDANSCTADATLESGLGTPGSVSIVDLVGDTGTFQYTTGSYNGDQILITVDCSGDGGNTSTYIIETLY